MANYVENFASKMDWAKPFQRTGDFPIDRSSLFSSYADAVKYAAGNPADPDSRNLYGTSYVGQVITVFENDVVSVYKITAERTLVEVGTATEGDGKSIILSDGILSLLGFKNATEGQQIRIVNKGSVETPDLQIEWFTPDTSTVEGIQEAVGQLQQTVGDSSKGLVKDVEDLKTNKADADKVYTKDEIDGKLTGALHYEGTKNTFQELLDAVAGGEITPTTGDVWNITTAGGVDASGVAIKAGDNVIYNGTGWDVSSGTVDLSAYYTKTETNNLLNEKVDKVEGSRLMTNEEGARLAEVTKVEASDNNGYVKLDGQETKVYELPTADANTIGGVKGSSAQDSVSVGSDGAMSINDISASKVKGVVSEAAKVSNGLTIGSKTYNGSAAVEITAEDVPIPDDVVRTSDIASETGVGVVKASSAQDGVNVSETGEMSVNDISASKVKGAVSEASKVTNKLTAGSKTFDGSANVEITAEDLGAMKTSDMEPYVKKTDIAAASKVGVVKASTAQDGVNVGSDGTMTVNDISASKVKGTVASASDSEKLGGVASDNILVAGGTGQVKSAAAADKLTAAKDITLTGDATGTASFDGSANAEIAVTLKNVGTAGTYTKVTTDAQGRVTAGEQLAASDIPNLTMDKITDAGDLATKDEVARTDLNSALVEELDGYKTKAHTHDNAAVLNGINASQVSNWDDAASKIDLKANTADVYTKSDVYTKTETDTAIKTAVAGAYHFAGTYESLAALKAAVEAGTITPVAGEVYNIQTAGGTDMNGTEVKAGDNVAYVDGKSGTGWDILAGTMDLTAYATTDALTKGLALKAEKTVVDGINNRLGAAETKIGTLETASTDHGTRLGTAESDITTLKNTVGDDAKGLVKGVADNAKAIETLNGTAETAGSVRNIVAASATEINKTISDITKDGGTIDTKISAHNTAEDAHADLFAAKQNKAIQAAITFNPSDFVENPADNGPVYKGTKAVGTLNAAKDYAPSVSPTIESCAAVVAAQFYPMAEVNGGALTLYCTNIPTAPITVNATFTEIQ